MTKGKSHYNVHKPYFNRKIKKRKAQEIERKKMYFCKLKG